MPLRQRFPIIAFAAFMSIALIGVSLSGFTRAPQDMASMPNMLAVTGQPPPDPANCATLPGGGAIPTGQANPPGSESEPMAPIWCFPLAAQGPPTRVSSGNTWVDTFTGVTQMGRFNDGDLDYRVYDAVGSTGSPGVKTQNFTNNNHWMTDRAGDGEAGSTIRPNRSFTFQNGKLIVEADVAAGITAYDPETWAEVDISTGATPTAGALSNDNLYMYGRFKGFTTLGCRLQSPGEAICAHMANTQRGYLDGQPQVDKFPCYEGDNGWRLIELSGFEACGNVHSGDFHGGTAGQYWRQCSSVAQVPDMMCRDRFRFEITQSSFVMYINGIKYFEDSNWPARNQLPADVANGTTPVYVYFSNFGSIHQRDPSYRFHWQRLAVNPTNGPNASPSFCLGQPGNTCAMAATPVATNTAAPATSTAVPPTSTSVPPTATTVPATATSIPATATPGVAPCRVRVSINGGPDEYRDQPNSFCGLP